MISSVFSTVNTAALLDAATSLLCHGESRKPLRIGAEFKGTVDGMGQNQC